MPDLAEAEVDVRYPTLAEGGAFLAGALRDLRPVDPAVALEVEGGLHYPPLERSAGVIALYGRAREVAAEMGMTLEEAATGGASEASFAGGAGHSRPSTAWAATATAPTPRTSTCCSRRCPGGPRWPPG